MGALVGVLALGIWVMVWIRRWRQEEIGQDSTSPQDQINRYQEMVEEGLLDPDELARIKDLMNRPDKTPDQPLGPSPPTNEPTDFGP